MVEMNEKNELRRGSNPAPKFANRDQTLGVCRGAGTSYPLRKVLIMLFRGEMSEDICLVRTVTEGNDYITFLEKKPLHNRTHLSKTKFCVISAG